MLDYSKGIVLSLCVPFGGRWLRMCACVCCVCERDGEREKRKERPHTMYPGIGDYDWD